MSRGGLRSTTAFLSLPLYFSRSALVRAFRATTGPVTFPLVPGVHPDEATAIVRPLAGSISFMVAWPRSHPTGTSHGSSRTFSSPYSFIFSAVQRFAFSRFFDPVSRGPITSERYWRLVISSELDFTSAMIFRSSSTAADAFATTRGIGAASGAWARATPPRTNGRHSIADRAARADIGRHSERNEAGRGVQSLRGIVRAASGQRNGFKV